MKRLFGTELDEPVLAMRAIEGYLTEEEAIALYEVSRGLPAPVVAVEIGSWHGKSSVMIASGIRNSGGGTLYALDPFVGAEGHAAPRMPSSTATAYLDIFLQNMTRAGVRAFVRPIQGYSHEVVKGWSEAIDFLFIDGEHEYDDVKDDFLQWSPHIRPGGFVAFHDSNGGWPGPTRVTNEELQGPPWTVTRRVHSLTIAQKLPQGWSPAAYQAGESRGLPGQSGI